MDRTYEEAGDLMHALIASQQETERLLKQQSQETDRKFQEIDRKIKEISTQIGKLGNRLGDFVEEMVQPALMRIFQESGLNVHHVVRSMTAYDDKQHVRSEVDLIISNITIAVVVECKIQLSIQDVNEHLHRLALFKTYFSNYAGMQVFGAVAAMVLPDNVGQYASHKGLYLLVQSGETVIIHNDAGFVPVQF